MKPGNPTLHVFDGHSASWALLHALAEIVDRTDDFVLMIGNSADAARAKIAGLARFDRIQACGNRPRTARRAFRSYTDRMKLPTQVWGAQTRNSLLGSHHSLRDTENNETESPTRHAFPASALDRRSVRGQWELDDETFVIGSAHDHPREVDAMRLVYHAALLSVGERPTVVIVPSDADQLERAARFAWRHNQSKWFVVDDRSPLLLRDAIDASCWQVRPKRAGTRTLEMLARSGQPVIAERCRDNESLEGENVRLCNPCSELDATKALFGNLVRVEATPDPDALIRVIAGSLAGD